MKKINAVYIKTVCFFSFFFFAASIFAYSADAQFDTLTDWSQACLSQLPEYPEKKQFQTVLTKQSFQSIVDDFKKRCKSSELAKLKSWLVKTTKGGSQSWRKSLFKKIKRFLKRLLFLKKKRKFPKNNFVQKTVVSSESNICFMGDIHGSIHSLLRNIWRLMVLGYVDNNFKIIKDNFSMVFLGDYVDSGHYGAEVWYTLLKLKLANWDKVFMIRGNHEDRTKNLNRGFWNELKVKFGQDFSWDAVFDMYRYLPLAIFIGSGRDEKNGFKPFFIQCCHGGINKFYSPLVLMDSEKHFEKVKVKPSNFQWGDFSYKTGKFNGHPHRGRGLMAHRNGTKKYMKINRLKAIFRGHQHKFFGLKMFNGEHNSFVVPADKKELKDFRYLGYWKDVVPEKDRRNNEFVLCDFYPVFTLSTAVATQSLPHDCFCVLTTSKEFKDWKLTVHEGDV